MKKNDQGTVAFWCEHAFAIYSVKPIVEKYRNRGNKIIFFTKKNLTQEAKSYLGLDDNNIRIIDSYISTVGKRITIIFKILFVPLNFSEFYYNRRKMTQTNFQRVLGDIFGSRNSNNKVNQSYQRILNFFYKVGILKKLDLECEMFFVFTKVYHPYLLTPFNKKIILIMESWDHPAKEPFLVQPAAALAWNKDLINDIKKFQKFTLVKQVRPLKFRYLFESSAQTETSLLSQLKTAVLRDEIDFFKKDKVVIYPMCTSSSYFAFEGEIEFLKELSSGLANSGLKLYIRPYPLAPRADIDILNKIPNCFIGYSSTYREGKEMLDDELMTHKYLIIKHAHLVINVGTTFVIEAALVNDSIIQLILETDKFKEFSLYSRGIHIRQYLAKTGGKKYFGNPEEFSNILADIDNSYALNLRKWLLAS